MIEYTIHIPKCEVKTIMQLWQKFFKDDPIWHYNFYDGFIRLKLEKSYPAFDKYITERGWKVEKNPYNEDIETLPVFKRNFDTLCQVLHGYTMLIMNEEDTEGIEDRIFHLFFNMQKKDYWEEAVAHNKHALKRARIDGIEAAMGNMR